MTTYAIAINRSHIGKLPYPAPEGLWSKFNGQFVPELLTLDQIAHAITAGYSQTTWHTKYRKAANFSLGQHIALDFDTEDERSTFPALLSDPFIAQYASIIHTTASHKADKPRARVMFLLDRPIKDASKYTLLAQSLVWKYRLADETCKDACRLFYGSLNCEIETFGNVLTLEDAALHLVTPYREHLANVEREKQEAMERARARYGEVEASSEFKTRYVNLIFDREYSNVANCAAGERHKALLHASLKLGSLIGVSWLQGGIVTEQAIYDTLTAASVANGEVAKYGEKNTLDTIRDGIKHATPRQEPIWRQREDGSIEVKEQEPLPPQETGYKRLFVAYRMKVAMAGLGGNATNMERIPQ